MFRRAMCHAALGAAAVMVTATVAPAATHDVDVGPGFSFVPADVTIQVGDTVRWTWIGGNHNVESGENGNHDGNFRSGDPTSVVGTTYELTFDQQFLDDNPMPNNEYPYYCIVHVGVNMAGTITVETPAPCPADIAEDDNAVNVFDLLALLGNWGADGEGADLAEPNDTVDVFDLLELLEPRGPCS